MFKLNERKYIMIGMKSLTKKIVGIQIHLEHMLF